MLVRGDFSLLRSPGMAPYIKCRCVSYRDTQFFVVVEDSGYSQRIQSPDNRAKISLNNQNLKYNRMYSIFDRGLQTIQINIQMITWQLSTKSAGDKWSLLYLLNIKGFKKWFSFLLCDLKMPFAIRLRYLSYLIPSNKARNFLLFFSRRLYSDKGRLKQNSLDSFSFTIELNNNAWYN